MFENYKIFETEFAGRKMTYRTILNVNFAFQTFEPLYFPYFMGVDNEFHHAI